MNALYDSVDHQVDMVLHVRPNISQSLYNLIQVTYRSAKEGVLLVNNPPRPDGSSI